MLGRRASRAGAIRTTLQDRTSAKTGAESLAGGAPGTLREKLFGFLQSRPAGAATDELLELVFSGRGSEPELGDRFIAKLLGGDPNFIYDPELQSWSLKKNEALTVPLGEASYVVVDLETTGGRPGPGTIIEIGAYRMTGRRIAESFQSLIRPHVRIPAFITGLTSITNEMVAGAPPIDDVLPEFRNFLGDAVMVAHNAPFDFAFLDFEFRRLFGLGLTNRVLCTLAFARRMLPSVRASAVSTRWLIISGYRPTAAIAGSATRGWRRSCSQFSSTAPRRWASAGWTGCSTISIAAPPERGSSATFRPT